MRSILLKLSGKIINSKNALLVKRYAEVISDLYEKGYRIAVVVGGGPTARDYISCAKTVGLNDAQADMIGIEIARVNALLLAYALRDRAYIPIPRSIEDVERAWSSGRVVVLGGLQPGQSTAGTAAVVAETLGIKMMLYATDVEGIYDKDPKLYPDAKKLDRVRVEELEKILRQRYEAGGYELLDPIAIRIVKRSCIDVLVFNGMDPNNVYLAIEGRIGTLVLSCKAEES